MPIEFQRVADLNSANLMQLWKCVRIQNVYILFLVARAYAKQVVGSNRDWFVMIFLILFPLSH